MAGNSVRGQASVKFGSTDLGWSDNDGLWAVYQFFEEAERWVPAGGCTARVDRAGRREAMTLPSGKPDSALRIEHGWRAAGVRKGLSLAYGLRRGSSEIIARA